MTKKRVLEQCSRGILDDLPQLIDEHKTVLYRFCYYLTKDRDGADDLFQQTWVRAIERIETYNPRRPFRAWINTIAANLYKDGYRLKTRLAKYQGNTDLKTLGSKEPTPEEQVEAEIELDRVKMAINSLEDTYRIPLLLYYDQELKYKDIAIILGIPTGTVKSRLNYARKQLKSILGGDEGHEG